MGDGKDPENAAISIGELSINGSLTRCAGNPCRLGVTGLML